MKFSRFTSLATLLTALLSLNLGMQSVVNADELDNLTKCEVKIEFSDDLYNAFALAPTVEEAKDAAIEEACALPCADEIDSQNLDENKLEELLEQCVEKCTEDAVLIASACHLKEKLIFSEGAWSSEEKSDNDSADNQTNEITNPDKIPENDNKILKEDELTKKIEKKKLHEHNKEDKNIQKEGVLTEKKELKDDKKEEFTEKTADNIKNTNTNPAPKDNTHKDINNKDLSDKQKKKSEEQDLKNKDKTQKTAKNTKAKIDKSDKIESKPAE